MRPDAPRAPFRSPSWAAPTVGAALVGLAALVALLAPWLAPLDPARQFDPASAGYLPPLSERWAIELDSGRVHLFETIEVRDGVVRATRLGETLEIPVEEIVAAGPRAIGKRLVFVLGTDRLGRDVLSRLLWGARASMVVGLLAVTLSLSLGITVGSIAAMTGGWVDAILMRGVDALLALPRLFLILLVTALTRPDPAVVVLILGCTGWMQISRLTRAQVLGLKGSDLEIAARSTGRHPLGVFLRHLLPNALTPLVVDVSLRIGDVILVEAALSYLGLGIQPPVPSWGNMVADGSTVLRTAWWAAVPAAGAITLTVLGFNLLGDGLRDRLDPRTARRA